MRARSLLFAVLLGAGGIVAGQAALGPRVWADATTGSISGVVKDKATGAPLGGVTVVVTGGSTSETAITEDDGTYRITGLAPGTYLVTFFFGDVTIERRGVGVSAGGAATADMTIDTQAAIHEEIVLIDRPPAIDPSSTSQGMTLDVEYLSAIPVGRTYLGTGATTSAIASATAPPDLESNTEAYARLHDNPFHRVETAPLSTFSIDVDTASYANARRFLRGGELPPPDAIRVEELLNYFHYRYPPPAGTLPFSISAEVGPSPWHDKFKLVRIGLQSAPIADAEVPARNLVFLLDVSGSMADGPKLPLLRQAMSLLVDQLRPQDQVSIVVYAGAEGLALPTTGGAKKEKIRGAIALLEAGGSTNGAAGIELAYKVAQRSFIEGGINRVILCTDGDFNVGVTSEGSLTRLIEDKRKRGVYLTVLGFGMGNLKDSTMEALADQGNGNYAYIDSIEEARKVLVAEAGATLVTVAKDVKIQVELNPAMVAGYRLIGYEDRMLADRDFADDTKDAGEIGAGHSVTALYEIVPAGVDVPAPAAEKLLYQTPAAATASTELLTVKVRYKPPGSDISRPLIYPVKDASPTLAATSSDFRWAAAIAGFGMLLRDAPERGALTWSQVASLAKGSVGADREGYRKQALFLIAAARKLQP